LIGIDRKAGAGNGQFTAFFDIYYQVVFYGFVDIIEYLHNGFFMEEYL
jgi:hypothetical protein